MRVSYSALGSEGDASASVFGSLLLSLSLLLLAVFCVRGTFSLLLAVFFIRRRVAFGLNTFCRVFSFVSFKIFLNQAYISSNAISSNNEDKVIYLFQRKRWP